MLLARYQRVVCRDLQSSASQHVKGGMSYHNNMLYVKIPKGLPYCATCPSTEHMILPRGGAQIRCAEKCLLLLAERERGSEDVVRCIDIFKSHLKIPISHRR